MEFMSSSKKQIIKDINQYAEDNYLRIFTMVIDIDNVTAFAVVVFKTSICLRVKKGLVKWINIF